MNDYLPNQCCPETRLLCGGQPDEQQLAAFAAEHSGGCVINLRPAAETPDWDESAVARKLGLDYVHIPVAGPQDLTRANVQTFATAVQSHGDSALLIHCASGQRVAALLALKAAWVDGCSTDQALAAGKAAGLDRMMPMVQAQLASG
ncbi:beta-lactamase hydrolase domain-containing protein [Dyella sp. A6]|uniref:beta-lactamase hydrolase domain-containing protein n=1 Tax=Dyella aluminiiresistens TaxID=3069105 RepID=UPI002E76DDF8|nr:sulfur transferase domain-containing protein [Dyella sp. A6]